MNKQYTMIAFIVLSLLHLTNTVGATTSQSEFIYDFSTTNATDTVIHYTNTVLLTMYTPIESTCLYTSVPGAEPSNAFEKNFGTKHEQVLEGLTDGLHKYYIRCGTNLSSPIMEVSLRTKLPISATIAVSEDSPFKAGTYEITLVTSTQPITKPTLEYSYDGLVYKPIPLSGTGKIWKGYIIIEKNQGEVIGSFKFKGIDLDGKEGTSITGNSVFIVDTISPGIIQTIQAKEYKGEIELNWHFEEDIETFNIYRSENPGVDFTNYYATTDDFQYSDTDVTRGKTYYYKIAAIDAAGNIGQFSREIEATALLENNSKKSGGLSPTLIGKVDNMLTTLQLLSDDIQMVRQQLQNKGEQEQQFFTQLQLDKEYTETAAEIESLKRDIVRYKEQDLTELELTGKLNAVTLRIDIIRKRVPESITKVSESEVQRSLSEEPVTQAILEIGQESWSERVIEKSIQETQALIREQEITVTGNLYNLEVVYLDGTRRDVTLITERISAQLERSDEVQFILIIPKEIAEHAADISFNNLHYTVLKEDPIIAFDADTSEIIYTLNKETDTQRLEDIILVPVKQYSETPSTGMITGFSILNDTTMTQTNIGFSILGAIFVGLIFYFIRLKKRQNDPIRRRIQEAHEHKNQNDYEGFKHAYAAIKETYKSLDKKKKRKYYKQIKTLHER